MPFRQHHQKSEGRAGRKELEATRRRHVGELEVGQLDESKQAPTDGTPTEQSPRSLEADETGPIRSEAASAVYAFRPGPGNFADANRPLTVSMTDRNVG